MANKTKHPSWKATQPHHAKTGKITTRKYAESHPGKVEWVKAKKRKGSN